MKTNIQVIMHPDREYAVENRMWQGVPSCEVTGKRLWAAWFTGGKFEPSQKNQDVVCYSDDQGKTWNDPYMIIRYPEKEGHRVEDPQFWYSPEGRLWLFFTADRYDNTVDDTDFDTDFDRLEHLFFLDTETWCMYTDDPENEEPVWSEPERFFDIHALIRNKPIVLKDGRVVLPGYDQMVLKQDPTYQYLVAEDATLSKVELVRAINRYGKKNFDEPMLVEKKDGTVWFLVRTLTGHIVESFSYDGMKTWTEPVESAFANPCTRFYIGRLKNGMLLMVNTPSSVLGDRKSLVASLSEDDGATWPWQLTLDDRRSTTYPDVAQDDAGNIYCIYDCQRDNRQEKDPEDPLRSKAAKEICMARFTAEDIMQGKLVTEGSELRHIISKCTFASRDPKVTL